jgi:hypothetical protein
MSNPYKPRSRWFIRRIRLNSQGYDVQGTYWGTGKPLWYAYSADGQYDFELRGSRDFVTAAYQWVRNTSDPERACRYLRSSGQIGAWS